VTGTARGTGARVAEIRVNVAGYAVGGAGELIYTIGLGSCVAIVLYDSVAKIGGMAHVMLPDETMARDRSKPGKFAGSAVSVLIGDMTRLGAVRNRIRARLVGGASMFASLLASGGMNIGPRNVEAIRAALRAARIPIDAEDVGSDYGRSVYLTLADGTLEVRSLKRGNRVL
jgi:chemotaxis protein CheD